MADSSTLLSMLWNLMLRYFACRSLFSFSIICFAFSKYSFDCCRSHAKGVCGAADQEEKFLDIPLHGVPYNKGEPVRVQVARHLGFRAVALGYLFPFLILMGVLISLTILEVDELKAGLFALLSIIPYYLVLYLLRRRIASTVTFSIRKL